MQKSFLMLLCGSILFLGAVTGCGPKVDQNAVTNQPSPQEEDPAAYEKEQQKLLRKQQ